MVTSSPTRKALTLIPLALALLLPISTLQAVPVASNRPVPKDLKPNRGQECKSDLVKAWCGEAAHSGAAAAPEDLPGEWATPAVQSNPDVVAKPGAVSADVNPPSQLDQAMLEGVRVRLRKLGLLWLFDLAQAGCDQADHSGADAAHKGLPGDWATPAVLRNDEPFVMRPEKASPEAVAEPRAVLTDANPPLHLYQALLEGVRVRLRNLGFLGLTDVSESAQAEAIRRFQASINIPETGVLNRDTLGRLLVP